MRKGFVFVLMLFITFRLSAQYSLTLVPYLQNFDGLGTGNSTVLGGNLNLVNPTLNGWYFSEVLSNADNTITAGDGSDNAGDTYNFGSLAAPERTLGGLQSGTLKPTIGFYVTNSTGSTITSLTINYTGEQWRLGTAGRIDRMDFQYSQNAASLTTGNWIDANALDFTAPVTTGLTGALDGNLAANKTLVSNIIIGLYIPNGANFFIRWNDFNAPGAEDGLGVDDFSLTAGITPSSTDYFRSVQSGNWTDLSTWESSPNNVTFVAATAIPNSAANTITLRNGHSVDYAAFLPVDEVIIENGGILNFTTGVLTVEDGMGADINIQSGGVFTLSSASNPPVFASGTSSVNVNGGGILRISASGLTAPAGTGVHISNFVYEHESVMEYTLDGGFGTDNVTYFPNANAATIPVFKTSNTSVMFVGANNPTTFNGIFECNGTNSITWQNTGNKIFRNGIRGTGNINANASAATAKFIISGTTAELGGAGSLTVPSTGGLEIGATTTVTMSADKTVTGNISLLSNSYVELGTFNLTATGNVTGGSATSYIRTASTGGLILNNVDVAGKIFPIGHTAYNPLVIENGSNHNWTAKVNDGVIADPPQGITGAVLLTWDITPSVNPPSGNADITFQFNAVTQTGVSFNPADLAEAVQAWHRKQGYWLAAGTPMLLTDIGSNQRTVKITGLSQFSPYALSRISLPLPIKLVSFNAVKINSGRSLITWELAACCSRDARFEVEKSTDGINYSSLVTVAGSETNRYYSYHDTRLDKGVTYYRLKMTDVDGKTTYSKIIAVINDSKGLLITTLAPNPVKDNATVSISAAKTGSVNFTIYDITGRPVRQWQTTIAEGSNNIAVNANGLSNGVYHLAAITGDSKTVIRFVKQ